MTFQEGIDVSVNFLAKLNAELLSIFKLVSLQLAWVTSLVHEQQPRH